MRSPRSGNAQRQRRVARSPRGVPVLVPRLTGIAVRATVAGAPDDSNAARPSYPVRRRPKTHVSRSRTSRVPAPFPGGRGERREGPAAAHGWQCTAGTPTDPPLPGHRDRHQRAAGRLGERFQRRERPLVRHELLVRGAGPASSRTPAARMITGTGESSSHAGMSSRAVAVAPPTAGRAPTTDRTRRPPPSRRRSRRRRPRTRGRVGPRDGRTRGGRARRPWPAA